MPDAAIRAYREALRLHRHRGLVVIAGGRDWCHAQVGRWLEETPGRLWVGTAAPLPITTVGGRQCLGYLGRECDDVVFDAHAGLDPDALGAISGTLRAGHILFLLTPAYADWPDYDDPEHARITVAPYPTTAVGRRFIRHTLATLQQLTGCLQIEQGRGLRAAPYPAPAVAPAAVVMPPCLTQGQATAVAALLQVVHGHRRRPLVLSADRGRGKSAALGIAAAQLLREGRRRLVVVAPSLQVAEVVLHHAQGLLPGAQRHGAVVSYGAGELRYRTADELLRQAPVVDLVLVDEAAAIPADLLLRLLHNHARIAFATTVHGYEGSGRGFELRFLPQLQAQCPDWRGLTLATPVRWREGDPLEAAVAALLLLAAEPAALAPSPVEEPQWQAVDRDALVADPPRLEQLFGLLVSAHYRTRPYDLRHLLDGPNLRIWTLQQGGAVVAVVVAAEEGRVGAGLEAAIAGGERRLHGHLLPQSLLAHAGEAAALDYGYLRVLRIAVHPGLRRRGLGRRCLAELAAWARGAGLDFIGTSFGADRELLPFWYGCGLRAVRLGFHREASSGSHAVMMLQALNPVAADYLATLQHHLSHDLPHYLGEPLAGLEPALLPWLLEPDQARLERREREAIEGFIGGRREPEAVAPALWRLLQVAAGRAANRVEPVQREALALLVARYWQHRPWAELAACLGVSGRPAVVVRLRLACGRVYSEWQR